MQNAKLIRVDFGNRGIKAKMANEIVRELNVAGKFVTLVAFENTVVVSVMLQSQNLKQLGESPAEFAAALASVKKIRHVESNIVWNIAADEPVAITSSNSGLPNCIRLKFRITEYTGGQGRKFFGRVVFGC